MTRTEFDERFFVLTGHEPFPWQWNLFQKFVVGEFPNCDIPTGLGKTFVIAVWYIAYEQSQISVPRRLVYVVNRRVVIDQSTDVARLIRSRLSDKNLLGISALRGQLADNTEWSSDPSRPALAIGTPDMIGSRLLFSGFRCGFKKRPLHAGFLGQDVLLVHDESHLEPSFQKLLHQICNEQKKCKEFCYFHAMELSATSKSTKENVLRLTPEDMQNPIVAKRHKAKKRVSLHAAKNIANEVSAKALKHKTSGQAILIFLSKLDDVESVSKTLESKNLKVAKLTGTIRGKERDALPDNPIFRRFLHPGATADSDTVYLVCTSAGEVGINISADHMVCDTVPLDSMIQRFGRVNRFGNNQNSEIDIVYPTDNRQIKEEVSKTISILRDLKDVSPASLSNIDADAKRSAFSPEPKIVYISETLLDKWSLTSIQGELPGRPPVEPYIHGIASSPPETYVAWREDTGVKELNKRYTPNKVLEIYPLKPQELLRDSSQRVLEKIKLLVNTLGSDSKSLFAWVIDEYKSKAVRLDRLADYKDGRLNWKTLILPPKAGGLTEQGTLDGTRSYDKNIQYDLADEWFDGAKQQLRCRIWNPKRTPKGMRTILTLKSGGNIWKWFVRPKYADDHETTMSRRATTLEHHTLDVEYYIEKFLSKLSLNDDMNYAIKLAAKFHDIGKNRVIWQRMIGNTFDTQELFAKPGKTKDGKKLKVGKSIMYRHELGSLVDVLTKPEFLTMTPEMQDLTAHLIAVHHGYGRPFFPVERQFDPESPKGTDMKRIIKDATDRFIRLQKKYGRWGLAFLESLLRAADYAASAKPFSR